VQAGQGRVRLLEVQPAGGKRMSFADFVRGRRIAPHDRLGPVLA
jgi:methionyl-tRNA formyltransferase